MSNQPFMTFDVKREAIIEIESWGDAILISSYKKQPIFVYYRLPQAIEPQFFMEYGAAYTYLYRTKHP